MFSISLLVSVWLLVVTSWQFNCKKTAIKVDFCHVSLHQADMHWWAGLQFQWDWSVASHHWPVCQYAHLCCRSQLPCPASTRGECAHRFVDFNPCVHCLQWESLVCSLHRWATGRGQLCCFYIPTSWSLCPRRWATCKSSKSSTSATTSEPSLLVVFLFFLYFLETLAWF